MAFEGDCRANARNSPSFPRQAAVVGGAGAVALLLVEACGASSLRRFPVREPFARDTDTTPVSVPCHTEPSARDPKHVACAPKVYVSPLAWDGIDNSIFRPLSETFAIPAAHEAANVNSFDEVPDSAWFINRLGRRPMSIEELSRGACTPEQMLDGEHAGDGTWVIDQGKANGSSPGFRVRVPGKGKYMLKSDAPVPERPTAASVIGAAAYSAVGFNTSCEQIVYISPSVLKLTPGLTVTDNSEKTRPFDEAALQKVIDGATHRGQMIRMQASAWLPGHLIGPFRYEGTREDDPNDIIAHEDRRDLRGARLLAAWLDHFDAREQNSMDSWITDKGRGEPDGSPGFVRHYYLDTSDCLGSEWEWDGISRRLGYSYLLDWGAIATDFTTLGLVRRPWDEARRTPGMEVFGYFAARDFSPENWVNEYPNPAFSRMSERDGAWMARILARFSPEMVHALAGMGHFSDPAKTAYLEQVLQGRLDAILQRYLTKLSPVSDVRMEGGNRVCATDLANVRRIQPAPSFHYSAQALRETGVAVPIPIRATEDGGLCFDIPQKDGASGGQTESDGYAVVRVFDGVAKGPLDVHLSRMGDGASPAYRLVGLERPDP